MAANFLSIKMREYLTKLQKSSKTERYLRKLSTMGVTMNILMETNAIEIIKPFTAYPSLGHLAKKIIEEWNEELSPISSPSSVTSTSDESCDSSDVVPIGKRRISHCKPTVKKARIEEESDPWKNSDEEAEMEYKRFSDRVDEAINKGIIAHPSHSSYGNEEKENAPAPKKRKEFRPKTVAPIRKQTKTIKKPTPLMNKVLRMAGRK